MEIFIWVIACEIIIIFLESCGKKTGICLGVRVQMRNDHVNVLVANIVAMSDSLKQVR